MLNVLFDDKDCNSVGLQLRKRPFIPSAERNTEFIYVDGRDGPLVKHKNLKALTFELQFTLISEDVRNDFRTTIHRFFSNSKKLSFSNSTSFYYKIKSLRLSDIDNELYKFGYVTVTVTCDPYCYEKETTSTYITSPITITNHTTSTMLPKIKIYGTGVIKLTINEQIITLNNVISDITLDSELMEAWSGTTINMNHNMIGNFPILKIGTNTFSYTGSVSKIEILKRWRWLQ